MRQSEQTQRMASQGELVPERKIPMSSSTNTNSNIPLMTMTPTLASPTSSSSSSALYKDLTSSLFDPHAPSQSLSNMPTSQTMPSFTQSMMTSLPSKPPQQQQPIRPTLNFSSSKSTDLTSSLLNNINSLGARSQTNFSGTPMNTMAAKSSTPAPFFNSVATNNTGALFQPPPPPGSTVIKGSAMTPSSAQSKSVSSELDDLFN